DRLDRQAHRFVRVRARLCGRHSLDRHRCVFAGCGRDPENRNAGESALGGETVPTPLPPADTPRITAMRVIPVAGQDSMLLNLSGAHAPYFTRNLVILTDSAGRTGVGEVPGGEKI